MKKKPLISLILVTYTQEQYIRDAVLSALNQDYENLEIIISDDCSSDGTWEIINSVVKEYKGPHKLVINRNSCNLGSTRNFLYAFSKSSGRLVVIADGDDESLPNRVSKLCEHWIQNEQNISLVFSNGIVLSEHDADQKLINPKELSLKRMETEAILRSEARALGCTIAFERKLIEKFEPLDKNIIGIDVVLYRRACLLDGALYIPNVLVRYRKLSGTASQLRERVRSKFLDYHRRWTEDRLVRLEILLADMNYLGQEKNSRLLFEISRLMQIEKRNKRILASKFLISTLALLFGSDFGSYKLSNFREALRLYLIRWIPSIVSYK